MDTTPLYKYRPLSSPGHIRLFRLHAGPDKEPLRGQLVYAQIEEYEKYDLSWHYSSSGERPELLPQQYEALSYEWGSLELDYDIAIQEPQGHDTRIRITRSLYHALHDLRATTPDAEPRTIWADALCIDQENLKERAGQVSIMGKIYKMAWRVVTYMGPAEPGTAAAIKLMHDLPMSMSKEGLELLELSDSLLLPDPSDPRVATIKNLVTRGWAGRAWCAQEFLLNGELVAMCGQHTLRWDLIPSTVQDVFNRQLPSYLLPNSEEDPLSIRECLAMLYRMRQNLYQGLSSHVAVHRWHRRAPNLLDLLCTTYPMRASDPRDKIYSLLGLAHDVKDLSITVDYECNVEDLYTSVAAQIICKDQAIQLLEWNISVKSFDLPSWVPDWSTWRFGSNGMLARRGCASGDTHASVEVDGTKLKVQGCVLDSVATLSELVGPRFTGQFGCCLSKDGVESDLTDAEFLDTLIELASTLSPDMDESKALDIVWRTLVGNMTIQEDVAPDSYVDYIEAFREIKFGQYMKGESMGSEAFKREGMAKEFYDSVRRRMRYRRICTTKNGFFGAVPQESQPGDRLCILEGSEVWFVVRQVAECEGEFRLLGTAYVHGLMNGEALKFDSYKRSTVVLV